MHVRGDLRRLPARARAVVERNTDDPAGREMLPVRAEDTPALGCIAVHQEDDGPPSITSRRPVDVEAKLTLPVDSIDEISLDARAGGRLEDGRRLESATVLGDQGFSPWYLPR
jgi:hypothetical protein